jgi:hypothetical protein
MNVIIFYSEGGEGVGRRPVIVFAVLCFAFIVFSRIGTEDEAKIRELFRTSGVEAAIYALPLSVRADGALVHRKWAADDRFGRAFDEAARAAYSPGPIFKRMVEVFRGVLTSAELRAVMLHYNSSLGRKITRVEAASLKASPAEKIAYMREAMADRKRFDARVALCRRLDAASRTTELGVTVAVHTLIVLQSALIEAGVLHSEMSGAELRLRTERLRPALRRRAAHRNMISSLFAYRELSASELRLHLQFLRSRSGRKLVLALCAAFDMVLIERAVIFGDAFTKSLKTLPL